MEGKAAAERILSALTCNPGFDSRTRGAAPSRPDFRRTKADVAKTCVWPDCPLALAQTRPPRRQIRAKKCRSGRPKTCVNARTDFTLLGEFSQGFARLFFTRNSLPFSALQGCRRPSGSITANPSKTEDWRTKSAIFAEKIKSAWA